MEHEVILNLISKIYEAVDDPSRWQNFLDDFVKAIRAGKGSLGVHFSDHHEVDFFCRSGWDEESPQIYAERYAAEDPWGRRALAQPEGAVKTDYEYCPREEFESSLAFREFYSVRDAIHGVGGIILATPLGQSLIAAVRGRAEGPFGEAEKSVIRTILPHLRRAALLYGQLGTLKRQLAILTDHLNRYSHGLLLVTTEGKVLFANEAAREIAAEHDGLELIDHRLKIVSARDREELRKASNELLARGGPLMRRVTISRTSHNDPYRLILMPVQDSVTDSVGLPMPAISILVMKPGLKPAPDVVLLAELFELTPAEARIAGKLAVGLSNDQIAQEMELSVGTVRTHVKHILSKTSTCRQGELISLVLQSAPIRRP